MHDQDTLVIALVRALERDSSPESLHRAVTALRVERGVSASRAYAILVRASAGQPVEEADPRPQHSRRFLARSGPGPLPVVPLPR
ncbi:MAG: hypothetical protein ABWY19_02845 [Marmoricola sp.]